MNNLQLYAKDKTQAEYLASEIILSVREVEEKFSRYIPESLISQINSSAGDSNPVRVDEETAALFDYALMCYEQSDGLFDITSGVLRKAWNFNNPELPSEETIAALLNLIGWEKVSWEKPFFQLLKKGMEIDFGGFGKEYAVDKATGKALELDVHHGFINLGGDVRVFGPRMDNSPWIIGITHPRKSGVAIKSISMTRGAIATSGDYERFFEINGTRYCHILNPKTGWPVQEMQSVSVFAESCLVAGSAATIAMLFGKVKGRKFLEDIGLQNIQIDDSGKVFNSIT